MGGGGGGSGGGGGGGGGPPYGENPTRLARTKAWMDAHLRVWMRKYPGELPDYVSPRYTAMMRARSGYGSFKAKIDDWIYGPNQNSAFVNWVRLQWKRWDFWDWDL